MDKISVWPKEGHNLRDFAMMASFAALKGISRVRFEAMKSNSKILQLECSKSPMLDKNYKFIIFSGTKKHAFADECCRFTMAEKFWMWYLRHLHSGTNRKRRISGSHFVKAATAH